MSEAEEVFQDSTEMPHFTSVAGLPESVEERGWPESAYMRKCRFATQELEKIYRSALSEYISKGELPDKSSEYVKFLCKISALKREREDKEEIPSKRKRAKAPTVKERTVPEFQVELEVHTGRPPP